MTRFFFDLHECGRTVVTDGQGTELADVATARAHAIAAARGIMAGEVDNGHLCLGCAITVRDEDGAVVMAVPFAEALSIAFTRDC